MDFASDSRIFKGRVRMTRRILSDSRFFKRKAVPPADRDLIIQGAENIE